MSSKDSALRQNTYVVAMQNMVALVGRSLLAFFFLFGALAGLMAILAYFGPLNWLLDLMSQFRIQYALYLVFCMALSLHPKQRKYLAAWSLLLLLNAPDLINLYLPQGDGKKAAAMEEKLRVLDMNLLFTNKDYDGAYEVVRKYDADVITTQELTNEWFSFFQTRLSDYRYHKVFLHDSPFGTGVFSRFPIEDAEVKFISSSAPPLVRAQVNKNGCHVQVLSVHTLPPSHDWWSIDGELSRSIGKLCASLPGNIVLAGDLNTTSNSCNFKSLVSHSRLKDSQKGFGWQPSWMTALPWYMRISIDHCLVSPGITVCKRELGPSFNSDHAPIFLELSMPAIPQGAIGSAQVP